MSDAAAGFTLHPDLLADSARWTLVALADGRLILELDAVWLQTGETGRVQLLLSRVHAHALGHELQKGALSLIPVPAEPPPR